MVARSAAGLILSAEKAAPKDINEANNIRWRANQIALILKKANTTILSNITPCRNREICVSPYERAA